MTPPFEFETRYYPCKLARVHDGDTPFLDIDCGFRGWRIGEPIRLLGMHAPELNEVGGPESAAALSMKLTGAAQIVLESHKNKREKYGRWLGVIWILVQDGVWENVNRWMLANHYAKPMP